MIKSFSSDKNELVPFSRRIYPDKTIWQALIARVFEDQLVQIPLFLRTLRRLERAKEGIGVLFVSFINVIYVKFNTVYSKTPILIYTNDNYHQFENFLIP